MNIKKAVKVISAIILVLAVLTGAFTLYYINSIENFKQLTFNEVLKERKIYFAEHFGIGEKKDPSDYGYPDYKIIEYLSEKDKIRLHAWYVAPVKKDSNKCILLIHGRGANKLRTMKYLVLFKETGIDREYGVFIPDFRNSGLSDSGKTLMGDKFAEDAYFTMKYLKTKYGYDNFIVYGFSMGAMAAAVLNSNPELPKLGISIEKIIMDSPLADVEANMYFNATEVIGLPGFLARLGFYFGDLKHNGKLSAMKLSKLIKDIKKPVLILQAENDPKTPAKILKKEMVLLKDNGNIEFKFFKTGEHVKIYQNVNNRAEYIKKVADFIKK